MGWRATSSGPRAMQDQSSLLALTASRGKRGLAVRSIPSSTNEGSQMTYRISGLDPADFAALLGGDEATLAAHNARRVVAANKPGFPCRVTLEDAEPGESLILLHH